MRLVKVYYGNLSICTIDANKHPDLQLQELKKLLENSNGDVEIHSNSPYVLFNITLIHSYVNSKIPAEYNPFSNVAPFINKHFEIKENGDIIEGAYYKEMISDENLLNDMLGKSNDDFSYFMELENKYC